MEETQREAPKNINNTLATLALIVAVGALVLAWLSYDKQTIDDTKETVRMEKKELDEKMEDAAGAAVQKTGEVIEATGQATQEVGSDIKEEGAMRR